MFRHKPELTAFEEGEFVAENYIPALSECECAEAERAARALLAVVEGKDEEHAAMLRGYLSKFEVVEETPHVR